MRKGFWTKSVVLCLAAVILVGALSPVAEAASKGFQFKKYGVTISMHGKAASFIKKAGKAKKTKASKSCAYDGKDRTYEYKDFILYTYSKSDKGAEYVNGITFKTKKVSTKEGIKIGSSEEKLLETYGDAKAKYGIYTYKKGKSKLQFEVEDGKVTNIRYVAI
jgi:hypothetical protein